MDIDKVDHRLMVVKARVSQRIDGLEKKIDGVAVDLAAHRRAHPGYWVQGK